MVLRRRHLAKALTYRVVGSIITAVAVYAVTGSVKLGLILAPVDFVIKTIFYYVHERVWHMSKWGVTKEKDSAAPV